MYKTKVHEICLSQNCVWHTKTSLKTDQSWEKWDVLEPYPCHMFGVSPSVICKCITTASQFKPEEEQHY
jgi:hypothetical protein